jgi:hypothetical protein
MSRATSKSRRSRISGQNVLTVLGDITLYGTASFGKPRPKNIPPPIPTSSI